MHNIYVCLLNLKLLSCCIVASPTVYKCYCQTAAQPLCHVQRCAAAWSDKILVLGVRELRRSCRGSNHTRRPNGAPPNGSSAVFKCQ